jgi:hypothetical protein
MPIQKLDLSSGWTYRTGWIRSELSPATFSDGLTTWIFESPVRMCRSPVLGCSHMAWIPRGRAPFTAVGSGNDATA